ncbi:LOW QUALITY PROTEIN: hypothetical protein MAR_024162, partial [Mya arenaria]
VYRHRLSNQSSYHVHSASKNSCRGENVDYISYSCTIYLNCLMSSLGFGLRLDPVKFCVLVFPRDYLITYTAFKYTESILCYFIPLVVQIVCYNITGKQLFIDIKELHLQNLRQSPGNNGCYQDADCQRRAVFCQLFSTSNFVILQHIFTTTRHGFL